MATHGELQPAAHADAVDRGHDGLGGRLTYTDQTTQVGLSQRHWRAKFSNVRAARKRFACAGDHDRGDGRVGMRLFDPVGDIPSGCITQAIDGRVLQGDHGDGAVAFVLGGHRVVSLWVVLMVKGR